MLLSARRLRILTPAAAALNACVFVAFAGQSHAQSQPVSITGGADPSGHQYRWTVTNEGASPVIFVEFPHVHADLFLGPPGWVTQSTNLVNVGVRHPVGHCRARVENAAGGLARGESAEFSMRIAPMGAARGVGVVQVRLADGTEVIIPGVELPERRGSADTFTSLIALGAIFALFLAFGIWRRMRRRPAL